MGISIIVPGVNWSENNLGTVTPSSAIPIQAIGIKGANSFLGTAKYVATVFPTFTNQRNVVWSITSGSQYATIDQTGKVTALAGANASSVTIRATSASDSNIYAEKTITATFGTIVYYDYIQSDGTGYILTPSLSPYTYGTKMVIRGTLGSVANYLVSARYASNSQQGRMGAYCNNNGLGATLMGVLGYSALTFTKLGADVVYRFEFDFSTAANATDGVCRVYYDATNELLAEQGGAYMIPAGVFSIFASGYGASIDAFTIDGHGACKFCNTTLVWGGETKLDFRACTVDGVPAIYDEISRQAYFNAAESGLTVGNF